MDQSNKPTKPERRSLLKGALAVGVAGVTGAAGGFVYGKKKGQTEEKASQAQHSSESYDCFGVHQQGIVTPHQLFGIVAAFNITAQSNLQLEKLFRIITSRIEFLTKGGKLEDGDAKLPPAGSGVLGDEVIPDGLTITVSVGSSLFDDRYGLASKKPKHLIEMQRFSNDQLDREWCDGDISIQFCAHTPETCQNALRDIIKQTTQFANIRWSIDGFLPKTQPGTAARNLLGFRDGSGNPDVSKPEIADQVLWTGVASNSLDEPAWAKNGSYQAVRIIRNLVEFWDRTPLQEQQTIFGREKYSGAPLGGKTEMEIPDYSKDPQGKVIPLDSHMRLANPRTPEFMKKHLLYRRAFNYSSGLTKSGQLDVGLIFICYQANLADGFIFIQNILNGEPLEEYILPFGGGYFFTLPGFKKGEFIGQSLLQA